MCLTSWKARMPFHAPFAPEAALLVAAAGRVGAEQRGVDVDGPAPDPSGHRRGGGDVGPVDLTRKPVDAVVGNPHGIIDVPVADDTEYRTEDLLLGRGVRVVGQVQHGRFEVVAPFETGAAGHPRRPPCPRAPRPGRRTARNALAGPH